MDYLDLREKQNAIADLIDLAKSDGQFNMAEATYLIWVSQRMGINQNDLQKLIEGERPILRNISEDQRLHQLHRLLNMVFVDGVVEDDELDKCRELSAKLGLDQAKTDHLIDEIKRNPKTMIEFDDLKAKFEGR